MGLFRYEAVDKTGKVLRGAMNARDENAVVQALAARGYAARGIQPSSGAARPQAIPQAAPSAATATARTAATGVPVSVNSIVSSHALAVFFRQLATMVRAGMPLTQGLTEATAVVRNAQLARALPEMQAAVNAGRSLSGAMALYPRIFPVYAISIVWCGELAGKLEIALDELATELEQEAADTRFGRVGWGITKISVVGLVLILPFFNMSALLQPFISESGGGELSPMAFIKDALARMLPGFLAIALPVSILLVVSWIVWGHIKRVPGVRRALDTMLLRSPAWGKLHRYRSVARFLHFLDMLHAAGVSPATAWDAASLTSRNNEIAEKLRSSREYAGTATVSEVARLSGVLEAEDVALIAGAEKAGDVPATLARLANTYVSQAEAQKATSRTWSISLLTSSQIAVGGALVIYMALTYAPVIDKLTGQ
jgi:type IV pilus assembly protein PilC